MKIETHSHTKEGSADSIVSLENTIEKLKSKNYDGMIVTDHNSYNGYDTIIDKGCDDFIIFKGVEYDTSDAGHMIIILPKNSESDIFTHKGMKVKDTIHIVKALGGIIGPAHPFDYYKLGILNNGQWIRNQDIIKEFDFVEGFNSCGSLIGNQKSTLLSKVYNKPLFGGSDSHRLGSVGKSSTILPESVKNEDELIDLVKSLKFGQTKVNGEYFKGTSKDKLGVLYKAGLATFYGVGLVSGKITRRKAIKKAVALSLI